MKITKNRLKQIIKEELEESDEALLMAIDNLAQKIEDLGGGLTDAIEDLDISIDFLSAAFIGGDPKSIGAAQKTMGRAYVPPTRLPEPPTQEQMKITKSQLKQIIKEEVEEMLLEDESGYISNIYAWCPAGTKCAPPKQKTTWWKGR